MASSCQHIVCLWSQCNLNARTLIQVLNLDLDAIKLQTNNQSESNFKDIRSGTLGYHFNQMLECIFLYWNNYHQNFTFIHVCFSSAFYFQILNCERSIWVPIWKMKFAIRNLTYIFGLYIDTFKSRVWYTSLVFVFFNAKHITIMMSLNGNIFRIIGPLCREFTGH